MVVFGLKSLAENKVLSENGMDYARNIALELQSQNFGKLNKDGTQ